MDLEGYTIDIEQAITDLMKKKHHMIALQIPEGLKRRAFKIVDLLEEKTKSTIILLADPCFGACDLVDDKLKNLDVDLVLHIGHTQIPAINDQVIPTLFVNAYFKQDVTDVVKKSIPFLEGDKIGLVTTAQHLHQLDKAKQILEKQDYKTYISRGDTRIYEAGQILGCNFSAAKTIASTVDSFLFIGSGMFHPLGLLLSTRKPVIVADPFTKKIKKNELLELKDTILRQRYGAIAIAKNAQSYGILLGEKQGQQRKNLAYEIKKTLEKRNKKTMLIAIDTITPDSLHNLSEIDCFVSTLCPRIAIDDYMRYKKPILTPIELEIAIGQKNWEDFEFDQILEQK